MPIYVGVCTNSKCKNAGKETDVYSDKFIGSEEEFDKKAKDNKWNCDACGRKLSWKMFVKNAFKLNFSPY